MKQIYLMIKQQLTRYTVISKDQKMMLILLDWQPLLHLLLLKWVQVALKIAKMLDEHLKILLRLVLMRSINTPFNSKQIIGCLF